MESILILNNRKMGVGCWNLSSIARHSFGINSNFLALKQFGYKLTSLILMFTSLVFIGFEILSSLSGLYKFVTKL